MRRIRHDREYDTGRRQRGGFRRFQEYRQAMTCQTRHVLWSTFSVQALLLASFVACSEPVGLGDDKVTGVTITPASINMNVGARVTLVATVTAGPAQFNRGVRWVSGNAAVATVDVNGVVASIAVGTTIITATALADTKIKGEAMVTVGAEALGTLIISAINQNGKAADLSNISGQLDVVLAVDSDTRSLTRVDLLLNCVGTDTVVATQTMPGASPSAAPPDRSVSPVTLSFNTAAFKNGQCILKAQAITTNGTALASAPLSITLNNPSSASSD